MAGNLTGFLPAGDPPGSNIFTLIFFARSEQPGCQVKYAVAVVHSISQRFDGGYVAPNGVGARSLLSAFYAAHTLNA
jgi:hypothetical protein